MTPNEKAEELVNKFLNFPMCESVEAAKSAAYIVVKECLKELGELNTESRYVAARMTYFTLVEYEISLL